MSEWITGKTPPPDQKPDTTLRDSLIKLFKRVDLVWAEEITPEELTDTILNSIAKRLPELEKLKKGDPYLESKVSYNQAILEVRAIMGGADNGKS